MPTYEYHCPACNATYDLRQSFSAETTHVCEECGKGTAKRVLHAPPVVFKGSGWYVKDSKSSNPASGAESTASESSTETPKTESKPASTSPEKAAPTSGTEASAAS